MVSFTHYDKVRYEATYRVEPRDLVIEMDGVMDKRSKCGFEGPNIEVKSNIPSVICGDMFLSGNMYHVACDHLCRAWHFIQEYDEKVNYIFSKKMWRWSQWAVNKVLEDRRCVNLLEMEKTYNFQNCYVSSNLFRTNNSKPYISEQHREYLFSLREKLTEGVTPICMNKVYISRKLGRRRRITNEQQLENKLLERGYFIICLEDLTPEEQIGIFMGAKTIVTAHGAALTNMVGRTNGTIYELRKEEYKVRCYQNIAKKMDLKIEDRNVIYTNRYSIKEVLEWVP